MDKYTGVGEFGTLLANAINADPRSLKTISRHLGIEPKTIISHIYQKHKPNFYTVEIYVIYLDRPLKELRAMIDRDYNEDSTNNSEFSTLLYDAMMNNDLTIIDLSEKIGVSYNTVRGWLKGQKISNSSYIKCIQFFLDFEGNTDYKSNTKLKEII